MRKAWEPILRMLQQRLDPIAIHDARTMNLHLEHQALRIHQKVALSALDLLAPVVATLFPAHLGGFDRLAVDDARARLRIALEANPQTFAHRSLGAFFPRCRPVAKL